MTELDEVARIASDCTKCRLSAGRTQVVFGDGHPNADLMFIGEGPGFHEDREGIPFVGAAGQLLNRLLGEIGLRREEVYITNVVRCLRGNAQVQLEDGSWERIGRLVRDRYEGRVMSVTKEGYVVPRRVIGWHTSPLGDRRVFKLTHRSAKSAGTRGRVSIQLTGDHPVLTEEGYVRVEDLRSEHRIASGQGLSDLTRDVVVGTLLGAGHLNRASSHLSFSHTVRHSRYAWLKARWLAELEPRARRLERVAVAAGGEEQSSQVVVMRTLAHRALRVLRRDFYPGPKRVPRWLPDSLNPRMLAVWFMDEGHTRIRPPRSPSAEIATCSFPDEDLEILVRTLGNLGITSKALRGRLCFDVMATKRLSEIIAPYVPPVMRYKLHPETAARIPFDPDLFRPGPRVVMFDEAEVEDVTEEFRTDRTFFCIDVEETHNFVTAGGVVHNCRPPGNRDPLPDEIEACKPFLMRTLELVAPAVLVTLGNFATRVILERSVAISRVRGQRFAWHGRSVIPTFHPAAALRGGGDQSPQMRSLRQDFATIRQVLEEAPPAIEEQLGLF